MQLQLRTCQNTQLIGVVLVKLAQKCINKKNQIKVRDHKKIWQPPVKAIEVVEEIFFSLGKIILLEALVVEVVAKPLHNHVALPRRHRLFINTHNQGLVRLFHAHTT